MSTLDVKKEKTFVDEETRFQGAYNKNVFRTLMMSYRQHGTSFFILILMGLIGRILILSNTTVIGFWADSYCKGDLCKPVPQVLQSFLSQNYIHLLLGLACAGFVVTLIYRILFSRLSAKAVSTFYGEVTYRVSRFPMSFFDRTPVGRVVTRFSSDYGNVFRMFGGPLAEFFAIIFDILAVFTLILLMQPIYLPAFILMAVLNYFIYKLNKSKIRESRRLLSYYRSPSISHFAETTQGAATIRVYGKEKSFSERFFRLDSTLLSQKLKTNVVLMSFAFQMTALTALMLLITGVASYFLMKAGIVSLGSIGVALTFVGIAGGSIQMFFDWMAQLEEAMTGVERLDQYLRMDLEQGTALPKDAIFETGHTHEQQNEPRNEQLNHAKALSVRIENLSFRYGKDLPLILKNVSLQIRAGEKIGVIGRTGSGKSSLIQALLYLYPIDEGRIQLDGFEPRLNLSLPYEKTQISLAQYRRLISMIAQDPVLFRGTLRENLSFENMKSDAELVHVLKEVGLAPWFMAQPLGLETFIDERGKNLSMGEKQLICMARCVLKDAPVIIMDEATSSIDPHSEELLTAATKRFFEGRTQIIIAHRLSTIAHCDRIVWLKNGELVAVDKPEIILPKFESSQLA